MTIQLLCFIAGVVISIPPMLYVFRHADRKVAFWQRMHDISDDESQYWRGRCDFYKSMLAGYVTPEQPTHKRPN